MKKLVKFGSLALCITLAAVLFAACGSSGVKQSEFDDMKDQRDALQLEVDRLTDFRAVPVSATEVILSWQPAEDSSFIGYVIRYRAVPATSTAWPTEAGAAAEGKWPSDEALLGARLIEAQEGSEFFGVEVTGLTAGTAYEFQIRGVNSDYRAAKEAVEADLVNGYPAVAAVTEAKVSFGTTVTRTATPNALLTGATATAAKADAADALTVTVTDILSADGGSAMTNVKVELFRIHATTGVRSEVTGVAAISKTKAQYDVAETGNVFTFADASKDLADGNYVIVVTLTNAAGDFVIEAAETFTIADKEID